MSLGRHAASHGIAGTSAKGGLRRRAACSTARGIDRPHDLGEVAGGAGSSGKGVKVVDHIGVVTVRCGLGESVVGVGRRLSDVVRRNCGPCVR